uniref:Uncharacterized protein n=1 Tax=Timema genevievae TaxID=629358 RepID=A0A7R9KAC7_TIMGE|nr:unnamed protein product [Timema genevievae]
MLMLPLYSRVFMFMLPLIQGVYVHVTSLLQGVYAHVTSLLQGVYAHVTSLLQGVYVHVTSLLQGVYAHVTSNPGCLCSRYSTILDSSPLNNSGDISVECVVIVLVVFPQDLLEQGLSANNFAMLGLGDIVIPGIFIALLLRFDTSLKRSTNMYFNVTFGAYFLGLMATILIMHLFKHAQPALLYLVPACLGAPLGVALLRGDIKALFQ